MKTKDYERATRTLPCPRCDAPVDEPCRTPSGLTSRAHSDRVNLTRRAFAIGIEAGLGDALVLLKEGDAGQVRRQLAFMQRRNRREATR